MQGEWDIEMADDDEGLPLIPDDEQSSRYGEGATIQDILSALFAMQAQPGGIPRSDTEDSRTTGPSGISFQDLTSFLSVPSGSASPINLNLTGGAYGRPEDEEEEEDQDEYYNSFRQAAPQWFQEVTEPQKPGVELLKSGDFGRVADKLRSRRSDVNIAKFISKQSSRPTPVPYKENYASNLIPNSNGTSVASYDANIYTGQYSTDSSFYYTCSQDFRLHIYDTTASPAPQPRHGPRRSAVQPSDAGLKTNMKVMRTIQGNPGRWTITDANLSPDNRRMIYSSITPTVFMTSTLDGDPVQTPIPFADPPNRSSNGWGYGNSFGIWSCRFSADGNEVVAGGSGKIFVYDLLANRRTVKISAHNDDVNSCCWADTASGNVLVSASDDTFLKVWDRRSLGASQKPSGVLIGHTEGITYVSAKGDGRYVISNGKDQAMRLWDLRKMRTSHEFEKVESSNYGVHNFDYRYPQYPKPKYHAHPQDCSVMTYRGHSVLRTLIRCHFSPVETTGAQYLYSGSTDGKIHIWSLDGRVVQVLDRAKTLPMSFDPSGPELGLTSGLRTTVCVRDVSWHSQEPVLMSAGWESGRGGSIVARHEWKGLSKMAGSLEDWVGKKAEEQKESITPKSADRRSGRRRSRTLYVPGAFESEEED